MPWQWFLSCAYPLFIYFFIYLWFIVCMCAHVHVCAGVSILYSMERKGDISAYQYLLSILSETRSIICCCVPKASQLSSFWDSVSTFHHHIGALELHMCDRCVLLHLAFMQVYNCMARAWSTDPSFYPSCIYVNLNFMLGLWRWIGDHQTPLCFLLSKVATLNKPPLSALGCNLSL